METQALQERDLKGKTAVHWAAQEGYVEVVRFLLVSGADPTITDSEGRTPHALAEQDDEDDEDNEDERRIMEGRASCVALFEVSQRTVWKDN
jgi:hypothetical protein